MIRGTLLRGLVVALAVSFAAGVLAWAQDEKPLPADKSPESADQPSSEPAPSAVQSDEIPEHELHLQADTVRLQNGVTIAEGNVSVRTRELSVRADAGVMDKDQVWVHLQGHVVVRGDKVSSTATTLDINLDTQKWRLQNGRVEIRPEFFRSGVAEPVYVRGQRIQTLPDRDVIEARNAGGTTCNKPRPHFELRSNYIRAIPGKKVTFRKPALYVFGSRVFQYPFDLTLALDARENKFIPEVGQNEVEGYYAKFAYRYTMGDDNGGLLRLHFTQLRGTGFGFDHELDATRQSLQLTLFFEPQEGAVTSRLNHRFAFTRGLTSDLSANYQRNSGYYGDTQSLSSNLILRRATADSDSQLGFQEAISQSSYSDSRRFSTSLSHQERLGTNGNYSFRATMRDSAFRADQPSDQELDAAFEYRNRQRAFDWQLVMDKRYDLDGSRYRGDSTYRALNRLPEFTISTDTDRINAPAVLERLHTRASLALGRFEQDPEHLQVSRAALRFDLGGRETKISSNTRMRAAARYYQSFYDEGSAQYVLGATTELRTTWGDHWTTRLAAGYSNPAGFSPIRLDYWGKQSDVQFQAVRLIPDRSRIDLSSGYDFVNDRWRTAQGKFEFMTSRSSKLAFDTGFDIEAASWRPLNARWMFAHPRKLLISVGGQYDLDQTQLRQLSLDLDWTVTPKWRLEYQTRYSGYTHSLDQMDIRVTRDLHCWIGAVSYSKLTGEFQINLGLKAFPSLQSNWGMQRGPRFDTGGGGGEYF